MNSLKKLTNLSDYKEKVTLSILASPLLNAENMHRVAMFRKNKECGTTIPLILYQAFKLKFMSNFELKSETETLNSELGLILRNLLSDIQALGERSESPVLISKTFQEIIFRHIIWNEPMVIRSKEQLLINNKRNRAHTVSGNQYPSCSIPSYLCRWLLEKDGLNTLSEFRSINSYVKRVSMSVHGDLSGYAEEEWKPIASFSRRVQNEIFMRAFKTVFSDDYLNVGLEV